MGSDIDISATEDTIHNTISRKNLFTVPDYQRLYSWKERQWSDLWHDLENIDEKDTHFLGSIVVIQQSSGWASLGRWELVDGQQRLTTISIILCAMRQYYAENSDPQNMEEYINNEYLFETDADNQRHPKLRLSRFDNDNFEAILNDNASRVEEGSPLKDALEFYQEKLENLEREEVDRLRKSLVGSITLVVVECENAGSAFKLFETLNNRGMELSAVDLMKNSLLQVASDKYGAESNKYEEIRSHWETVLENVVYEINNPDRFFRHYMMSCPEPDISDSITSSQLYDKFRETIEEDLPTENIDLVDYVEGMAEKSSIYTDITRGSVDIYSSRPQKQINLLLRDLGDIGASHSRTLLLRTFGEFKDSSTEAIRVIKIIERFMARWQVADWQTGSKLDRIFSELCSDAFDTQDPVQNIKLRLKEEAPNNDEFRAHFATDSFSRNAQTKYFLDAIERGSYMPSGEGKEYDRASVDIEHIAPQQAFTAKKYSTWRDVLGVNAEEFKDYRNRIGNLTLLEDRLNESARDDPFQQKKDQYSLSDFNMTQEIRDKYEKWTVDEIEQRSDLLATIAVDVWTFDEI